MQTAYLGRKRILFWTAKYYRTSTRTAGSEIRTLSATNQHETGLNLIFGQTEQLETRIQHNQILIGKRPVCI